MAIGREISQNLSNFESYSIQNPRLCVSKQISSFAFKHKLFSSFYFDVCYPTLNLRRECLCLSNHTFAYLVCWLLCKMLMMKRICLYLSGIWDSIIKLNMFICSWIQLISISYRFSSKLLFYFLSMQVLKVLK